MDRLQELQNSKNAIANRIKELADRFNNAGQKWEDGADAENFEKASADYDKIVAEMQSAKAAANVAARIQQIDDESKQVQKPAARFDIPESHSAPRFSREQLENKRCEAIRTWFKGMATGTLNERESELANEFGLKFDNRVGLELGRMGSQGIKQLQRKLRRGGDVYDLGGQFFNAAGDGPMTTVTAGTGGNLIPAETFVNRLEVALLAFGGMRQVSEIIRTNSGETLTWPTVEDAISGTRITGELKAENVDVTNSGVGVIPAFSQFSLEAYKYSSKAIFVPHELLEDSAVDLVGYIAEALGERLARVTNSEYTTGDGSSKPSGIADTTVGAAAGVTAASATAITADELIDLVHSVDPAYRMGASFMMADSTVKLIRKLKDGDGQYLWQANYQAGVPDSLIGFPVVVNQDMPAATTGNVSVVFGDLSKYKIRVVNEMRFYRLDERYRDKDQTAFVAFCREDGGLLNAGTDPVKRITMA